MNKERAINIILEFTKDTCDTINRRRLVGHQEKVADDLTAAILFLERDREQNKKNAQVEIEGVGTKVEKGI